MSPARFCFSPLGSLHVFLYEGDGSSLLGHVDISKPAPDWNTLFLCLPRSAQTVRENYLSVLGASGLSFAVEVEQNPSTIVLNKPQSLSVKNDDAIVFQFIPPEDISKTQLDITVTSQSSVPAYLKVSQCCKDVGQEKIEVVDYKKASLRLSFAKKGRITLSKASVPPLTDSLSSWFIGIALKNTTGRIKFSEPKHVTVTLTKTFDYSYETPICTLIFASLLGGLLVSITALYLFKESLVVVNCTRSGTVIANKTHDGNTGPLQLPPGDECNNEVKLNRGKKSLKFTVAMLKVLKNYWFSDGPKTYSYVTDIVRLVLSVGAYQFVFAN